MGKGKKRPCLTAAALVVAVGIAGCGSLNPFGATEKYSVVLTATGTVPVAATSLGKIDVPTNGIGLLNLAVSLAGQHLAQSKNLKGCLFESYPPTLDAGKITLTASAICTLQGQQVNESIALALTPVTT